MKAVVTSGNGGYDKLNYCDVPKPELLQGEVLIRVSAAGINNTEINTRLGWYSDAVTTATDNSALQAEQHDVEVANGGWNESTPFPLIQGTDCCGEIVAVAADVETGRVGARVLVRPCMRITGFDSLDHVWMASDFDGAFAQFVKAPASEVFDIECDWSDAELATIPCAYGTAENMIQRAAVCQGDHVLVTGASGGVGSAVVQLVKRRGAQVTAIAGKSKMEAIYAIGADTVIERGADLIEAVGDSQVDVVVDNVAGADFAQMLKLLRRGGWYVSSGAIAGPMVNMDMRDFYLKDLNLIGCTAWDEPVFPDLVGYIEAGEIKPLLAKTFALQDIVEAQQDFLQKHHVGKFVLIPPA
ncbi:MAG: zinc-binding dehydrogenase [Gammaproteobacteria bacterium]|nr:zinc-binding dehydrogenase [Gammaproteobacteria bacterium]